MSQWQRKLDLSSFTEKYDEGEISIQEFAKIVGEKLKSLCKFNDVMIDLERDEIADLFEDLAADDDLEESDFNYAMEDLYNWGDTSLDGKFGGKKVCWIQMR